MVAALWHLYINLYYRVRRVAAMQQSLRVNRLRGSQRRGAMPYSC